MAPYLSPAFRAKQILGLNNLIFDYVLSSAKDIIEKYRGRVCTGGF